MAGGHAEVPQQRCYTCHDDAGRAGRYEDKKFVHQVHVAEHSFDCLNCHTAAPGGPPPGTMDCRNACPYHLSQVRMTWYQRTGLDLSLQVSPRGCAPLTPAAGEEVTVRMTNWRAARGGTTELRHWAELLLGSDHAAASTGRAVDLGWVGDTLRFAYEASDPAPATAGDGGQFPVAFDLCVTIGDQAVTARLVCQPKSTGMLCHL